MFWHHYSLSLNIHLQAWATDMSQELLKKKQTWNSLPWVENTEIFLLAFFKNTLYKHLATLGHTLATDPCKTVVKNFSKEAGTSSVYALLIEPRLIFPFIDKLYFKSSTVSILLF